MQKRILIADDEINTRELMANIATKKGYDVITAIDGVDLLAIAAKEKFDAIITDLKMPHLNGASATEIMKLLGNTTPVIVLTALSAQDISLVKDKFTRIYQKPCNISELFEYIETLIGK